MKFAVSNIAWSPEQRLDAYALLRGHGFTCVEIAPGLFFAGESDPLAPSAKALRARVSELKRFGLTPVSMQSLLFNVDGAELFGAPIAAERLAFGLTRAIGLAGRLGIGNLVFGSPKQRVIPPGLSPDAVLSRVLELMLPLADLAAAHGTRIALEPNPVAYGTNFMTTFPETIEIVRAIAHPAVTLNFDTGALYMTDSFGQAASFVAEAGLHLSHIHLSSANLAPAPPTEADARVMLDALATNHYEGAVSIEMKAIPEDGLATLAASVGRLHAAASAGGYL
jgi:sugar phosphate isomerase/epimerase